MNNAEWMLKNGYKFRDLDAICLGLDRGCKIRINGETVARVPLADRTNAIICWLDEEYKEPILDDVERRYLNDVIGPFRNEVKYISKSCGATEKTSFERIEAKCCRTKDGMPSWLCLPVFDAGTMYKGMEPEKKYTLEELGL